MKEQSIEKLFRDTFSNYEADVDSSVWTNIEQGLPAAPKNIPGSSPVAGPAGFLRNISLNTVILVTAISATLIGTAIYFLSRESGIVNTIVQVQPQAAEQAVKENSAPVSETVPAALQTVPVNESKNPAAEKQSTAKAEEKMFMNEPPLQIPSSETKTENVSNSNSNSAQVSMETNSTPEPVIAAREEVSSSLKIYTENSQQDAAKNYTSSVETSASIPGSAANVEPAQIEEEEEILSATEEQFRFFIPNGFSPNGDLINDFFMPIGNKPVKDYDMTIYDRYGFEVFRSRDIAFPWDGKLKNGKEAAQAVYVYMIKLTDFNNEEHDYMGYVVLLNGFSKD